MAPLEDVIPTIYDNTSDQNQVTFGEPIFSQPSQSENVADGNNEHQQLIPTNTTTG